MGINLVPPFIGRTVSFDMRTQTVDIPYQETEIKDDRAVRAAGTLEGQVIDAKKAFLEVETGKRAVSNVAQT